MVRDWLGDVDGDLEPEGRMQSLGAFLVQLTLYYPLPEVEVLISGGGGPGSE